MGMGLGSGGMGGGTGPDTGGGGGGGGLGGLAGVAGVEGVEGVSPLPVAPLTWSTGSPLLQAASQDTELSSAVRRSSSLRLESIIVSRCETSMWLSGRRDAGYNFY
jgi:hypothetical protein